MNASPLTHIYRLKGENFEQKIWDKVRCYWEHPWGTHCEVENLRDYY